MEAFISVILIFMGDVNMLCVVQIPQRSQSRKEAQPNCPQRDWLSSSYSLSLSLSQSLTQTQTQTQHKHI